MSRGFPAALVVLVSGAAMVSPAHGLVPELSAAQIEEAIKAGTESITREEFGEEWLIRLPGGEEIVATTPYSRLVWAARQAAFKGEPLTDKQRQEQLERGKGRVQLLVTMFGRQADFARWYQALLRVGDREVKATFVQNERTPLRLEDGRFAARNVYVFPLEDVPPRSTVTLVVRHAVDQREVLRADLDLSKMR